MTVTISEEWSKKNQQYLVACITVVKDLLRNHIEKASGRAASEVVHPPVWNDEASRPAIEYLSTSFGLSGFERSILILCAAAELDSEVSQICAMAQGDPAAVHPTFSLALAAFPDAHWSALAPTSPLRRFRLVDIYGYPQIPVTKCQLQIEERVLHYLAGVSYLDKSLHGIIEPVRVDAPISESQEAVVLSVIHAWKSSRKHMQIQLVGLDEVSKRLVASWVCRQLGINLWQTAADLVPARPDEIESLARLWTRESALLNAGLYISALDAEPAVQRTVRRLMNSIAGPVILSTSEPWPISDSPMLTFEVSKPTRSEQCRLWKMLLENEIPAESSEQLESEIIKIANQFNLNTSSIQSAAHEAMLEVRRGSKLSSALWSASQKMARPRLLDLAQRIESKASMEDLVLPEREKQLLRSIIATVRQRYHVYAEWGFGSVSNRGLGITALFSGESGTGKTLAAEVLAMELALDLYKIDLSMVVSKYIGETEKNLRRIFDAAEDGGAILFFDEADTLFGKRSEVRDSHDRYANIEVGYLLQRMEAYTGLAILTTNMKDALDRAFARRIMFVVNFPSPDEKNRKEIWKKVFPKSTPQSGLNFDQLAQLDVTGGHIRNIALAASFIAAEEGLPVNMRHIKSAAEQECYKMERPVPKEIGDWK